MTSGPPTEQETPLRRRAASLPADERRSMIVAATLPLLLEHGETITTHDIACAAGIAEGTIFRVFANKDALIEAAIQRALDISSTEEAIAAIDDQLTLDDAVIEVVAVLQRRVLDIGRLLSSVGTRFHVARRPPPESAELVRLLGRYRRQLTVDPADAARGLRSLTLAMTHPMLSAEPVAPADVARRFLYGVATPC